MDSLPYASDTRGSLKKQNALYSYISPNSTGRIARTVIVYAGA